MSTIWRNTNSLCIQHLLSSYYWSFPLGTRNCYWRTTSLLCSQSRYLIHFLLNDIASLAGKKSEELEEIEGEVKNEASLSLQERLKVLIYKTLQKNAFITILLLASVLYNHINNAIDTQSSFWSGWLLVRTFLSSFLSVLWCYVYWQSCLQSLTSGMIKE